jgi:hypothetical protein
MLLKQNGLMVRGAKYTEQEARLGVTSEDLEIANQDFKPKVEIRKWKPENRSLP